MNHLSPAHVPEIDFSNVEAGTLLWLLHCGNMPSSKTSISKHPFKLAVSMVMTIAVFTVIVRSFAAVSKHCSCYFTQVILLRFIPFHSYFLFQLKGSTFTFCSISSSLSYGGLGHEPHTGLRILSQTRSDSVQLSLLMSSRSGCLELSQTNSPQK